MKTSKIYQLKISLDNIEPPIWRRIQVPGSVSLFRLHFIFQLAMGWTNSHLHEFAIDGKYYGEPDEDGWDTRQIHLETDYSLEQVVGEAGSQFAYLYDFGDSWQHTIVVEEILEGGEAPPKPTCLGGERACPPEDVGGTYGYQEFLETIQDPDHPEHDSYLIWAGGEFDPEAFDREQVDQQLRSIDRTEMMRVHNRYVNRQYGPEFVLYRRIKAWLDGLTSPEREQFDQLPLRRDAVTFLTYLRDHRVTGTQATGNLPLKAIREVCAGFVNPPVLERKIGDRVRKLRTEYDIWPVYFIHAILKTGGLLRGGPSRKFRVTPKGQQFLEGDPAHQVCFLLESWWFHTNWLIAWQVKGLGDRLPYDFTEIVLDELLALAAEKSIPFEPFADSLIKSTGWKWSNPDGPYARQSLHSAVKRLVIDILVKFGIVSCTYQDKLIGNYKSKELQSFLISEPGMRILQVLRGV